MGSAGFSNRPLGKVTVLSTLNKKWIAYIDTLGPRIDCIE